MTYRDTRSSYPPTVTAAVPYPTSPTRSSLPFQYSTARPPTGFSEVETAWSQPTGPITAAIASPPPPVPRLPSAGRGHGGNPFDDAGDQEEEDEELYARSDWESNGGKTSGTGSAWSRSSWAGPTTGGAGRAGGADGPGGTASRPPLTGTSTGVGAGVGALEGIMEDEEWTSQAHQRSISYHDSSPAGVKYVYGQGGIMDSPAQITPIEYDHHQNAARRSMIPSELELKYLKGQRQSTYIPGGRDKVKSSPVPDPLTDTEQNERENGNGNGNGGGNTRYRKSYNAQTTPDLDVPYRPQLASGNSDTTTNINDDGSGSGNGGEGYKYMTPESHQKLGRMSVAPARYTLPQALPRRSRNSNLGSNNNPSTFSSNKGQGWNHRFKSSSLGSKWLTYRIFINTILTLIAALLLTISNTKSEGLLSTWIKVSSGVFDVSRAGDGSVGLGSWGWCPATPTGGSTCQAYTEGDFANSTGDFMVPDTSTLSNLSSLLIALTCFTWFLSIYQTVTSFFHYYLFFILSLPLSHFNAPDRSLTNTNGAKESSARAVAVVEVDLRVKCERPPFDYAWVWWCWWAHRRSPLGHLWAIVVHLLAIATFITAFLFKKAIVKGTNTSSSNVTFGGGAYVPMLIIVLTLDTTISSIRYFASLRTNWQLFTDPPSPSAAAILIPASEKPLHHFRRTNLSSFFAPRQTTIDQLLPVDLDDPNADIPPVPQLYGNANGNGYGEPVKLDEETIRWLAAYPHDEELVPLISSLRTKTKQENQDFLLSEVGLLYLRPGSNPNPNPSDGQSENEGVALLVPPRGIIRREILEDTHLEPYPTEGGGREGHNDVSNMIALLSKTFWWNGLSDDVQEYIDNCRFCKERKRLENIEARTGMTEVPFTGITDWKEKETGWRGGESAMAAEMAVALRRAQEEAEL